MVAIYEYPFSIFLTVIKIFLALIHTYILMFFAKIAGLYVVFQKHVHMLKENNIHGMFIGLF